MISEAAIARAAIVDLTADLADIPHSTDVAVRRRKSRDFYWTSPVLKEKLKDCLAEVVFTPRDEADLVRVAAACVARRVPITVRGAGTGNYGQAVPTVGGAVIDMAALDRFLGIENRVARAQAGIKLGVLDRMARARGLELKHYPSTKRTATIGGYFAGGSAGVGAVAHGGLREPGNLLAARIVTLEDEPRVLELESADAAVILHTFGTLGIVTELSVPLAPARRWHGVAHRFPDLSAATRFASARAAGGGVPLKLLSVLDSRLVDHMRPFAAVIGGAADTVLAMIDEADVRDWCATAEAAGGALGLLQTTADIEEDERATPIYEYSYGHSSLMALKADAALSYTQIICPLDRVMAAVAMLEARFAGHVLHHLEYMIFDGTMHCAFYPMLKDVDPADVDAIAAACEQFGLGSANPHVSTVEGGSGYKRLPVDLAAFKRRVDPYGLLNPGKL